MGSHLPSGCHQPKVGVLRHLFPGPFSTLEIGRIAHAIGALAFVPFHSSRAGFPVGPTFFGEPGLQLTLFIPLLPGSLCPNTGVVMMRRQQLGPGLYHHLAPVLFLIS